MHLSIKKHDMGSVNERKKEAQREKIVYSEELDFSSHTKTCLGSKCIIKCVFFNINYFQVIFLKSDPLHLKPNVSR